MVERKILPELKAEKALIEDPALPSESDTMMINGTATLVPLLLSVTACFALEPPIRRTLHIPVPEPKCECRSNPGNPLRELLLLLGFAC